MLPEVLETCLVCCSNKTKNYEKSPPHKKNLFLCSTENSKLLETQIKLAVVYEYYSQPF